MSGGAAAAVHMQVERLQEIVKRQEVQLTDMRERWGAVTAELQRSESGAQQASATAAAMREGAAGAEERCAQLEAVLAASEQVRPRTLKDACMQRVLCSYMLTGAGSAKNSI